MNSHVRRVCVACGDAGVPMEEHHLLGVGFARELRVDVCAWPARHDCHGALTRLQLDCRVVLGHDCARSEGEELWTFVSSWMGILALSAVHRKTTATPDESLQLGAALGRAVDQVAALCDEPRPAGPDPRASDVRAVARRRMQSARKRRPPKLPSQPTPGDSSIALRTLLERFSATAQHTFAHLDRCGAPLAALATLSEHSDTLIANLEDLQGLGGLDALLVFLRNRSGELGAVRLLPDALTDPALAQTVGPGLREVDAFATQLLELLIVLATVTDVAEAERTLDAFLEDTACDPIAG